MIDMFPMLPLINARSRNFQKSKRALHVYNGQHRLWKGHNVTDASDPWPDAHEPTIRLEEDKSSSDTAASGGEASSVSPADKVNTAMRRDLENATRRATCNICRRNFPLRKTMLRHLRTVHAPKDLTCPTCGKSFIRQDNLNRHIAEQHRSDDHFTECDLCGRRVSKRGLTEHMSSRICKASQEPSKSKALNDVDHLYVDDEDDCFLLTMRVLKLWLPLAKKQIESTSIGAEGDSHDVTSSDGYGECVYLGARALDSMRSQMEDSSKVRKCLRFFCTAVLWACISLIGVQGAEHAPTGFQDWNAHLKGASVLLKVFHQSTCDCHKYLLCPDLQQRANQDPALRLLREIVRDTGLVGILLSVLPALVKTWEHSIQLLDVLLKCIVSQIGRHGDDLANWQLFCESNGIESENCLNRGLEAMIWAMLKVSVND